MMLRPFALALVIALAGACDSNESPVEGSTTSSEPYTDSTGADASSSTMASTGGDSSTGPMDVSTDSTSGDSTSAEDPGETSSMPIGDAPTFEEVFEAVLVTAGCTSTYCHGGGKGALTMADLDGAYTALVGTSANAPGCDRSTLVVAGDPDASILYARIDPTGSDTVDCFSAMPKDADPLPAEQVELVRAWIEAGAPR